MKKTLLSLAAIVLLFAALPVYAQDDGPTGCDNSPENPTAILAVVGSAGALLTGLRVRIKARNNSSKES
jgi:XrtJ-associated TM-motif-TM protein